MIDKFSYLGFPLEPAEVKQIAFDYAEESNILGFSQDLGTAGRSWFNYLMKCFPKLSVKGATNISIMRANASSLEVVMLWFENILVFLAKWASVVQTKYGTWTNMEQNTQCETKKLLA